MKMWHYILVGLVVILFILWLVFSDGTPSVEAPTVATSTIATTTDVEILDTGLQSWTDTRDKGKE